MNPSSKSVGVWKFDTDCNGYYIVGDPCYLPK